MPTEEQNQVRRELLDALMEKVESDPYPSSTVLNIIESILTDDERGTYVESLLARIRANSYPSVTLVRRVNRMSR